MDAVIVNGEGTFHHGRGEDLLAFPAAAQRAARATFVLNALVQDMAPYAPVFSACDAVITRDPVSFEQARALGARAHLLPDAFVLARFADGGTRAPGNPVVTDYHGAAAGGPGAIIDRLLHERDGGVTWFPLQSPIVSSRWRETVGFLRGASCIVSARHHGCYAAALAGRPFVVMASNSHKMQAFRAMTGDFVPYVESSGIAGRRHRAGARPRSRFRALAGQARGVRLRREGGRHPAWRRAGRARRSGAGCRHPALRHGVARSEEPARSALPPAAPGDRRGSVARGQLRRPQAFLGQAAEARAQAQLPGRRTERRRACHPRREAARKAGAGGIARPARRGVLRHHPRLAQPLAFEGQPPQPPAQRGGRRGGRGSRRTDRLLRARAAARHRRPGGRARSRPARHRRAQGPAGARALLAAGRPARARRAQAGRRALRARPLCLGATLAGEGAGGRPPAHGRARPHRAPAAARG
ncbi:polysaccharide pyruvyl transferase family protein [Ramlibacter terrae]|uniref:Polysaccharide pyruvyl transferase family protein n=1 Tax=Ramlibacter terrae TaxID=2732511 RepID=A0ABX6P386_9BURK|nr:polysaccharide pyruvyl transferase family protein [Ramlibacter terrae]